MICDVCGHKKTLLFTSAVCDYCDNTSHRDAGYVVEVDGELHGNRLLKAELLRTEERARVNADDCKDLGGSVKVWKVHTQTQITWNDEDYTGELFYIHTSKPKDVGVRDAWLVEHVG